MEPFTTQLERGFLRLRWGHGVEITHPIAAAAARALAELHGPAILPLLVHMHGITGVTAEARAGMHAYKGFARVAVVGEDTVDEVMSGFAHRSPTTSRYFSSETDAVAWLLDTRTSGAGDLRFGDDEAGSRFVATLDGELAGFAAYERSGDTVVFTHTVVDEDLEGRGIGSSLIRHALDDARSEHLTVVPRCGFVAAFIEEHPEYRDLTAARS